MSPWSFQWGSGWVLALLLGLPVLIIIEWRKRKSLPLPNPDIGALKVAGTSLRQQAEFIPFLLRLFGLSLLVIAAARPQLANTVVDVQNDGIDIVLTLDTSGSMKALDLKLEGERSDRLSVVKNVVAKFIKGRSYDRIGMVVFGDEAYTQCPLTLDYDILHGYLDLIQIGIAGEGTAIGNGIATAVKRLDGSTAKSRIIILLTDGRSNAGAVSPMAAAELAAKRGIKIYTISVGTTGNVPYPEQTPFGTRVVYVKLDTDDETMKAIAQKTGGQFFSASSTEILTQVYETIGKLEKSKVEIKEFTEYQELFEWAAYPAAILLIFQWLLRQRIFVRIP
jgi:Ca-activated chloride channel family protein